MALEDEGEDQEVSAFLACRRLRAGSAAVVNRRAFRRLSVARVPVLLVAVALVLLGCDEPAPRRSAPQTPEPAEAEVVVDEATLPVDEAYEFAAVAPEPEELTRQWRRFRLTGDPPDVDFDTQVVIFVGFGESGSCPYEHGGVEIDAVEKRVSFIDGADGAAACTDDYNPRTLGLTIDRTLLPDGVFQVQPPNGAAVSVAAKRAEMPPQEEPDVVSATISEVYVALDPEPVATDGQLDVGVRNDSNERVAADRLVRLDRWTGLGFEPADPPQVKGDGDVIEVGSGAEEHLLAIDVAAHGLTPGWYRVTVNLGVTTGDYGRLLARHSVELAEPSES